MFCFFVREGLLSGVPLSARQRRSFPRAAHTPLRRPAVGALWTTTRTSWGLFTWPTCVSRVLRATPQATCWPSHRWAFVSGCVLFRDPACWFSGIYWQQYRGTASSSCCFARFLQLPRTTNQTLYWKSVFCPLIVCLLAGITEGWTSGLQSATMLPFPLSPSHWIFISN